MLIEQNYKDEPALHDFKLSIWKLPQWIMLGLIRVYQRFISSALPQNTCRFYPSCSHYGYQAIYKYGFFKGTFITLWRIIRCNPFNQGGYDPVP